MDLCRNVSGTDGVLGVSPTRFGIVIMVLCTVTLRPARLILGWVTVRGYTISVLNQPPKPTEPGHPSVSRQNDVMLMVTATAGEERRVLPNSMPYDQEWIVGILAYSQSKALAANGASHLADIGYIASLIGVNPRRLKASQRG